MHNQEKESVENVLIDPRNMSIVQEGLIFSTKNLTFQKMISICKFNYLVACYAHTESHNVSNFILFTQLVVSRRLRRSSEGLNFQRFDLRLEARPVFLDQTFYHPIRWGYQPTFDSKNRCDFTCRKVYESFERKGLKSKLG